MLLLPNMSSTWTGAHVQKLADRERALFFWILLFVMCHTVWIKLNTNWRFLKIWTEIDNKFLPIHQIREAKPTPLLNRIVLQFALKQTCRYYETARLLLR